MKIILLVSITFMSLLALADSDEIASAKLTPERCKLQDVILILNYESVKREASIENNINLTLNEMSEIAKKATNKNKSIGEQISKVDREKFDKASHRLEMMHLAMLIESRYQRDLMVIGNLAQAADNFYRWHKIPRENDSNYIYLVLLVAFAKEIPLEAVTKVRLERCNLDYALYNMEKEAIENFNDIDVKTGAARLKAIANKYHTEKINMKLLSEADKDEVVSIENNIIRPAHKETEYIHDLENIRALGRIALLVYQTNMREILYSGGDINKIGQTIENQIKQGKLNKVDAIMYRFWHVINEKIPSFGSKEYKKINITSEKRRAIASNF